MGGRVATAAAIAGVLVAGWWAVRVPSGTSSALPAASAPEPQLGAQATLSSNVVQHMVAANAAMARGTIEDVQVARAEYERAAALDERYAPAHAGLAGALVRLSDLGVDRPGTLLPTAVQQADLSVELDPANALGWQVLADAEVRWTRDWSRAELHYRRALALNPRADGAVAGLARLLAAQARPAEAMEQSRDALATDPTSVALLRSAGIVYHLAGRQEEALRFLEQALEHAPDDAASREWKARALASEGRLEEALQAAEATGGAGGASQWVGGYIHALAGRRREAEAVLSGMERRAAAAYVPSLAMAYVSAALGLRERALALVETSVQEHSLGTDLLLVDPILASLGNEPRFRAALAAMKLGGTR